MSEEPKSTRAHEMEETYKWFCLGAAKADRAGVLALAHAMVADRSERLNKWLGVPVVILTAIVGTSVFASLSEPGQSHPAIAIAAGALSILASALAAVQTFLNFAGRTEAHSKAAGRFHRVRSELEHIVTSSGRLDLASYEKEIKKGDELFAQAYENSPRVSLAMQRKAKAYIEKQDDGYAAFGEYHQALMWYAGESKSPHAFRMMEQDQVQTLR